MSSKELTPTSAPQPDALYASIAEVLQAARMQVRQSVNSAMVQAYWQVGRLIVEDEQQGQARAGYGKAQLSRLADKLTADFGKGFDVTNLRNMRRFYLAYPIRDALRLELSWTHYRTLIRLENEQARLWYMQEAAQQAWSARALERQMGTLYYERLLSSKEKAPVTQEAQEKTLPLADNPKDYLRDPYILDFLKRKMIKTLNKKMQRLTTQLKDQFEESARLEAEIKKNLMGLGYEC